jgi:Protein of unknown function (DUF3630)
VPLPLEVLAFEPMASGHRSLRLTTEVTWDGFADYAEDVVWSLGGTVDGRVDSPVERVWDVTIEGERFWLAFDDFALGVSLDARDARADAVLDGIRWRLTALRGAP